MAEITVNVLRICGSLQRFLQRHGAEGIAVTGARRHDDEGSTVVCGVSPLQR